MNKIPMSEIKNSHEKLYKILLISFILCFLTSGLGNHFFGIELFTDISTLLIYFIFVIQLLTNSLKFSKIILYTWLYIIVQTFILNYYYIDFLSSFKQFIGLILYSLTAFSFISIYKGKIINIIISYYRFSLLISCLVLTQTLLFVFLNISFLPQNILSGHLVSGHSNLIPEILGFLPRAIGVFSEPAHYVSYMLPSAFIALNILTNEKNELPISKSSCYIIIFSYIISFSLVGYFGLGICLFLIFKKRIFTNFFKTISLLFLFLGLVYFILNSPLGDKVNSFITTSSDITGSQYASGDQSSFALLSNLMVAFEGIKQSKGIGTGINTHIITYDKTITDIFSLSQIPNQLNKDNAGAIFIRLISEFGLFGILGFVYFLYKFRVKNVGHDKLLLINDLSFVTLIMYSSRTGHYLNIVFMFFLATYFYSYKLSGFKYD
jgi:hypothetical protein